MKRLSPSLIKITVLGIIALIVLFTWDLPIIKKINSLFINLQTVEQSLALSTKQGNSFSKALLDYENYVSKIPSCQTLFQKTGEELDLIYDLEKIAKKYNLTQKLNLAQDPTDFNENLNQLTLMIELDGPFPKIVNYLNELSSMKLKLTINGINFKQNNDNTLSAKFLANTYWLKENANCN